MSWIAIYCLAFWSWLSGFAWCKGDRWWALGYLATGLALAWISLTEP